MAESKFTREDLLPFCATKDREPNRDYLWQPWTRGGFTYATDGHVLVRVDAITGVNDEPQAPDAEHLLVGFPEASFTGRWGRQTLPASDSCPACGQPPETKSSVSINELIVDLKFIRRIWRLPALEVAEPPADWRRTPVYFRFDGGIGAFMGMSNARDRHFVLEPLKATPERSDV